MRAARRTHPVGAGVTLLGASVHHPVCWWMDMSLIGSRHDPEPVRERLTGTRMGVIEKRRKRLRSNATVIEFSGRRRRSV
jgi:hypothetical protein